MSVAKRVPYEKCKTVPSVDCGVVLKTVPDLNCYPEVVEDCRDVAQEVPYIGTEEKCEELVFDECVEVRMDFSNLFIPFIPILAISVKSLTFK